MLLTARFWGQVLPETLQIPISTFCFVALWWRGLTALPSQCVYFSLIDVGRVSSAYVAFLSFLGREGFRWEGPMGRAGLRGPSMTLLFGLSLKAQRRGGRWKMMDSNLVSLISEKEVGGSGI
eukprot:1140813-Pelagomonas_calceolata.AAC.5